MSVYPTGTPASIKRLGQKVAKEFKGHIEAVNSIKGLRMPPERDEKKAVKEGISFLLICPPVEKRGVGEIIDVDCRKNAKGEWVVKKRVGNLSTAQKRKTRR